MVLSLLELEALLRNEETVSDITLLIVLFLGVLREESPEIDS